MARRKRRIIGRAEAVMIASMSDAGLRALAGPEIYDFSALSDAELRRIVSGAASVEIIAKVQGWKHA